MINSVESETERSTRADTGLASVVHTMSLCTTATAEIVGRRTDEPEVVETKLHGH